MSNTFDEIAKQAAKATWDAGHQALVQAGTPEGFRCFAEAVVDIYQRLDRLYAAVKIVKGDEAAMAKVGQIVARLDAEGPFALAMWERDAIEQAAGDTVPF